MNERFNEGQIGEIAARITTTLPAATDSAVVVALSGELGAGKTTLTQAIARELGVSVVVQSPTFVISKYYDTTDERFDHLVHIDAYRIEKESELIPLRWESLLKQPRTVVIVEWPERIAAALPQDTYWYRLSHEGSERTISYDADH